MIHDRFCRQLPILGYDEPSAGGLAHCPITILDEDPQGSARWSCNSPPQFLDEPS
jgi:hypothetical protein